MRHANKAGNEISGFIDYEDSLRRARSEEDGATDWYGVFHHNKRLWPSMLDMSFYNWRTGDTATNNTENFKVIFQTYFFLNKFIKVIIFFR